MRMIANGKGRGRLPISQPVRRLARVPIGCTVGFQGVALGMRQFSHQLLVPTRGQGLYEVTSPIDGWLREQGPGSGLLTVFIAHTSASLVIQENADPDVLGDLAAFFARLVPEDSALYRHVAEGPDDMPAHIRAALTQSQLSIPIRDGRMGLGTWQGVFVFEHRSGPHERRLSLHVIGE